MSPIQEHGDFPVNKGVIHKPYEWEYANAAARTGASGFVSGDIGKLARQSDDNTLWMLTATTPTWQQVGLALASQAEAEAGTDNTKGMTPLRTAQAIAALVDVPAGGLTGMQVFTTNGTFTVPDGVTAVRVICVGGGGGAGGGAAAEYSGSGGGGGYSEKIVTGLTPGDTVTVTVGAGGTAGTSTTNGGTGGTSSFGSHVTAPGGGGGTKSAPTSGAGGNPTTTGALNIPGEAGLHKKFTIGSTAVATIQGGRSFLCHSLLPYGYLDLSTLRPSAGVGIGCGAAGGTYGSAFSGAAGASGIVVVQW